MSMDVVSDPTVLSKQGLDHFVRSLAKQDNELPKCSSYAACLAPLLESLGWRGPARQLIESLPHCAEDLDLVDVQNVVTNLGFQSRCIKINLKDLDPRLTPCLYVMPDGRPIVLLAKDGVKFSIYDPVTNDRIDGFTPDALKGTAYLFDRIKGRDFQRSRVNDKWTYSLLNRFQSQISFLAVFAFLASLPGLITPLFIMILYDRAIPAQATSLTLELLGCMFFFLIIDLILRVLRSGLVAHISTRIGRLIACEVFKKILSLPPQALENARTQAQLRRIYQFENMREHFTDPLVNIIFNIPFSILFFIFIFALADLIVVIPIVVMAIYGLLSCWLEPRFAQHQADANEARQVRDACFDEMVLENHVIKVLAAEDIWIDRFRNFAAGAALSNYRSIRLQNILQIIGQTTVMVSGALVLFAGTLQVISETMTVGALIATMTLFWRVIGPWQQGISILPRLAQIRRDISMLDQIMRLPSECDRRPRRLTSTVMAGDICIDKIAIQHEGSTKPALIGVELSIKPGELIAITGGSGSGKSSLLKAVAGIYLPKTGSIRIEGIDLRQINPREHREIISYAPQYPQIFTGTIAQNLRLALPSANDVDLEQAAFKAGLLVDIKKLPYGFETRVGDKSALQHPPGFVQRLSLARAFLRESNIILLDEPGRILDTSGDEYLREQLHKLKRKCTIILTTHRPSHLALADRIYKLTDGRLFQVTAK